MLEGPILVTGASGFLGQRLVSKLREKIPKIYSSDGVDLTSREGTRQLFEYTEPKLVFHLAALVGGIEANRKAPGDFIHDNLVMGLNVLDTALNYAKKLVLVGTCCSYPKDAPIPLKEESLWDGYPEGTNAPYGIAKRTLIEVARAYRKQYGVNYVSVIPANLYGPGDNFDLEASHVIPGMIRRFLEAKEAGTDVQLWGDGTPTREFLFVDDAASGLVAVAEQYNEGAPLNIGTGVDISIYHLAMMIAEILHYKGVIYWDKNRPNGQPKRMLDVSAMEAHLKGFEPLISLRDGLVNTIAWYISARKLT